MAATQERAPDLCIRLAVVSEAMLFNQLDELQRHKDSRRETEGFATKKIREISIQTICLGNISQISFDIGPVLSSLYYGNDQKKKKIPSNRLNSTKKMLMPSNISMHNFKIYLHN